MMFTMGVSVGCGNGSKTGIVVSTLLCILDVLQRRCSCLVEGCSFQFSCKIDWARINHIQYLVL
jgi:hypothetical protein